MYELVEKSDVVINWPRIEKVSFEVLNINSGSVLAVYHYFEYDLFNEDDLFYWDLPTMRCIEGMPSFYEDLSSMFE